MKVKTNTPDMDFPERPPVPENCKNTNMYPVFQNLNLAAQELDRVPDILGAKTRTRKHAAYISMSVIPSLDQIGEGPVLIPQPPAAIIDADDYEELKQRLVHEIDFMITIAKAQAEKKLAGRASGPRKLESDDNAGR